ncbi:MAG TPA: M48 family metallopeptidase [Thermohalobaculum sp.]|nr:M48 family metallopeptidase [Thermohalobaculum sp.]
MARRPTGLEAEGRYFDGLSSRPQTVTAHLGERSLVILGREGAALDHWPLASLRALNARSDAGLDLAPGPDSDERLHLSDARMVQALRTLCPELHRRRADRRGLRRALVFGVAAVAAVAVLVLVVIPRLADQLALLIPPEREMALGDSVAEQVQDLLAWIGDEDAPGYCAAPEGVAALAAMTARLDAGEGLAYPLRIAVLDHPLVNAVALPGGRILLFQGLIDEAESPEEVAAVLAHEIGHVEHHDPTRNVLRSAGTAGILGLVLGDVFGASIVVAASEAALNASYQREAEARADEAAHRLLQDAGLPLTPFARFFERLQEKYGELGQNSALRYFASHPGLAERAGRAVAADRIGDDAFEPVLDDRGWVALRDICSRTVPDAP